MDAWGSTVNNDSHNDTHQDNRKDVDFRLELTREFH